jgi:FKBP-type peptidyl-prolyl cis-trans isomerase (trigger factor)
MGLELPQYLDKIKKSKEDMEKDWRPSALKRVMSALAFAQLAKDEKIAVTSQEIEDEMNKTLKYYQNQEELAKNIDMERLYNYTKGVLENEEVFKYLEKL